MAERIPMMIRNYGTADLEEIRFQIRAAADDLRASVESLESTTEDQTINQSQRTALISSLRLEKLRFVPEFRSDMLRSVSVSTLSLYDDEEFIENAYIAVLRHRPDPQGKKEYLERLRRGCSKFEIILRLRLSAEGRSQKAKISGLIRGLASEILCRIPLLGYFFRALIQFWKLPGTVREIRLRQEMLRSHTNHSYNTIEKKINETILTVNSRRDASNSKDGQIS